MRSERKGWRWSVKLSCVVALLILWTSAADGLDGPETIAPTLGEPTLAEVEFYLNRIDTLTIDLRHCREALAVAEEPDCEGVSFTTLAIAVGVGLFIGIVAE